MKNIIKFLFSFLIVIALIGGIGILGISIYNNFINDVPQDITYTLKNIALEEPEEKSEKKENTISESLTSIISRQNTTNNNNEENSNYEQSSGAYFYQQLENNYQRKIYDELLKNKQNLKQGNYIIHYGSEFSDLLASENGSDKLGDDYQTAIEAFTHDNPELFYLDVNKMFLNIEKTTKLFKTTYNVYISASANGNYLSENFQDVNEIEIGINNIEKIKNNIMKNLKGTDYQNLLYIHDCLVDNIEYDTSCSEKGTYTIYGALIGKRCVCEGYTKAFKYLVNAAGLECEIMQGIATNSAGEQENHAWNCVKLNGIWYEVDCTWDDPIIIGKGVLNNNAKYRYFLKGTETFEKDHQLSYQFSENGKMFSYPTISTKDY